MTRTLRPYQRDAVKAIHKSWGTGVTRTGIVMATGLGKTSVLAKLATDKARDGGRVLCLAHRAELLDQIGATCKEFASDIPVGRVQASRHEARRPIVVGMAQTLASAKRRARMIRPDLVIVDEAHHAASPSYMEILSWAGSFDHTPTLGVTATMVRGDKRGLGDVWQEVCFELGIKWGIDHGHLVPPRGRVVVTDHLDLDSAKVSRGDYQDGELGDMVEQDVDQIVKAWLTHASDRLTVAFTPSVASAQALAGEFRAAGVPVGEVYGNTSRTDRLAVYAQLNRGEIRVLVNVMVATEGFDAPAISCVLMARPTRLPGLYTQTIGRGLRPSPGKDDCLVLDVVGASRHQRLVTLIDLHETAEYDTSELDNLPCDDCGEVPCECPPDERDGGDGRRRLEGPATYADVDLFATSPLNWLFTHGGKRFLPAGDRMALLWPEDELYAPGHCTVRGYTAGVYVGKNGMPLGEPMELHQARQLAEAWALAHDPSVSSRSSSWRKRGGPASEAQINMALRCGVENPETMNKARLSDEISIALASRVLDS